jgi:protein-S-isoprenylcysteine O-methyltransferase Ste14
MVMSIVKALTAPAANADTAGALPDLRRNAPIAVVLALLAVPGFAIFHANLDTLLAGPADDVVVVAALGRLLTAIFTLSAACFAMLRLAPRHETRDWRSTTSALGGSFLLIAFNFLPQHPLPAWLGCVAAGLVAAGYLAATLALFRLGRSFSILPAARRLVVDGPYAFVRHPLYLAEELAIIGMFMQYAGGVAAGLMIVHFLLQLDRMRHEERVLSAAFPAYAAYAARTARLIPGIY